MIELKYFARMLLNDHRRSIINAGTSQTVREIQDVTFFIMYYRLTAEFIEALLNTSVTNE
jgi:hypothetical protein